MQQESRVDILNRDEFINRIIQIVKQISAHKSNLTFAINGEWGCGKTFVLEEIQRRLNAEETDYLVIPYNCWQYDYYDEPLVAIVAALIDFLKKTKRVANKTREKVAAVAKQVGKAVLSVGAHYIEDKTNINIEKEVDAIKEIIDGVDEAIKIDDRAFDAHIDLKDAIDKLKKALADLSKKNTIVFCVDELDRCLPEYAIKVLERLHHIAEGMPNMITILAVDKARLSHTVNSIFGQENANSYLKKFIRFEIKLDKGKQNGPKFFERFPDFYKRFDAEAYGELNNTEQFLDELLRKLDIRTREQVVERATIINDICFSDVKKDHSVMYMELFFSALYYGFGVESIFKAKKSSPENRSVFANYNDCAGVFNSTPSGFSFSKNRVIFPSATGIPINPSNVFMVAYYFWYNLPVSKTQMEIGVNEVFPYLAPEDIRQKKLAENLTFLRKYLEVMQAIG